MKIADFPTVKLSSFLAALKLDIDNYAILVKSALCALIRTRPRCLYKPTVYFCEFSDKFQPPDGHNIAWVRVGLLHFIGDGEPVLEESSSHSVSLSLLSRCR